MGLALLQMATTIVDNVAYYVHPQKATICEEAIDSLDLNAELERAWVRRPAAWVASELKKVEGGGSRPAQVEKVGSRPKKE